MSGDDRWKKALAEIDALNAHDRRAAKAANPDTPLCMGAVSEESAACYRGVVERRKRLDDLEEAVGKWLHIRDQMDDLDEVIEDLGRRILRESPLPFGMRDLRTQEEALGKREILAVDAVRDLMAMS